jgi:hypothetical protein
MVETILIKDLSINQTICMKLYFLFILCYSTMFCEAQKINFKKKEFSVGLEASLSFTDLKKYNKVGSGLQLQYSIPNAFGKSIGVNFAISGHMFKNHFITRDTILFSERRPLNNARFLDLSIGLQRIVLKKIAVAFNSGFAITNVNSSDAPKFLFLVFKPSLSYRINQHVDFYSILHLGRTAEDDFIFQSFGLKYIF